MQIKAAASSGKQGDTPDQRFMTSDTCQLRADKRQSMFGLLH